MHSVARNAMKHTDLKFTRNITRKDFIVDSHYKSFVKRARILGLM